MALQEIFIKNLKYYRKQKNMTQNDLTLALDKSYNYINGIEQGKSFPPIDTIEKICEILEINASQLFDENASPENIKSTFQKKYSVSLQEELTRRVTQEIADVCRKI